MFTLPLESPLGKGWYFGVGTDTVLIILSLRKLSGVILPFECLGLLPYKEEPSVPSRVTHRESTCRKKIPLESFCTAYGTGLMPQQGDLLMSKGWLDADLSIPIVVTNGIDPHHMPAICLYQRVSPVPNI